jgi:hypothetical protein
LASIKNLGIAAAIGTATYALLKKPDGTPVTTDRLATTLTTGLAKPITGLFGAGAIDPIKDGISKVLGDANKVAKSGRAGLKNIVPNPMELFASYTFAWTLACLEPKQFNNPPSYRNSTNDLKHVVFASGGRFDNQRTQTAYGAPEYFVNNFQMNSTIAATQATGNTNAVKFTFDIIEPHSMGLLLQSLQLAATNAGYANYLSNAPFVLRLDFLGHDETGKVYSSIKPKFYTVALVKVAFTVNENGSVYKCEAVPYNHKGFSDVVNTTYTDVKLTCSPTGLDAGTVKDLLVSGENSLCKFLNSNEIKLYNESQIGVPDVYEIQFPEKSSDFISQTSNAKVLTKASADPNAPATKVAAGTNIPVSTDFGSNPIGSADFGFDQKSGGNIPFKKYGDQVDEKTGIVKRDEMTIDPKNRAFQFGQNQNLTAIINQIILSSTYSKQALDPKNMTPEGMIKWWRLDTQIQLLDYDPLVGDFAKKIIYRVVPFLVHHSVFTPPNSPPVGYEEIKGQIVKEYNYIYTGQNTDVLKFDIEINNLFFTGMNPSAASESAKVSNQDQKGVGEDAPSTSKTSGGSSPAAQLANLGRSRLKRSPELLNKPKGGSGDKTSEQVVAENFHSAMVNSGSGDLINVNLEILGDPYWMVDSGMANYFSPASPTSRLITEDGTVNYEGGDVMIYLTFRTPADINEATGLYEFPTAGKESPFSGIYRVLGCENSFNDGIFKQKLKCVRMVGQSQDYTGNNPNELSKLVIDKLSSIATVLGKDERPKSTLTDDPSGDGSGGE